VSARAKLLGIFLACAAPFLLAWATWYFGWAPGSSGNYGELLAPRVVSGGPLPSLRGKWVLVVFDSAACDAYCQQKLYYMRQIRRAQGKDQDRVERLWVITDGGTPRPQLLEAYEGTHVSSASPGDFPGERRQHIYLVDPLGNLMMRFPPDPDPSKMLKDLQRLLKYSAVG
jgi:hypothetical protein